MPPSQKSPQLYAVLRIDRDRKYFVFLTDPRGTDVFIKEDIRSSHGGQQALWTHLSGEFVLDPWLCASVDSSPIRWCESCKEATGTAAPCESGLWVKGPGPLQCSSV